MILMRTYVCVCVDFVLLGNGRQLKSSKKRNVANNNNNSSGYGRRFSFSFVVYFYKVFHRIVVAMRNRIEQLTKATRRHHTTLDKNENKPKQPAECVRQLGMRATAHKTANRENQLPIDTESGTHTRARANTKLHIMKCQCLNDIQR